MVRFLLILLVKYLERLKYDMKKNKKVWIFNFWSLFFPLLLFSIFLITCFYISNIFIFVFSIFGTGYFFFSFLWNIQFLIFKDDYFTFGNIFKKELRKIKYDEMIVIVNKTSGMYPTCYRKKDEPKEKIHFFKKDGDNYERWKYGYMIVVFADKKFMIDAFEPQSMVTTNLRFKKTIHILYNEKLEKRFKEIQSLRGKRLDGTKKDLNQYSLIEEEVKRILDEKFKNK